MSFDSIFTHSMSSNRANLTGLSDRRTAQCRNSRHLTAMARASLSLLLMVLGGPSCLVTSSPEFEPPKRTPPYITQLVYPPSYQIFPIVSDPLLRTFKQIDFAFELLSEDLQSGPVAELGLDFRPRPGEGDNPVQVGSNFDIPPGHMSGPDSGPRHVTISLTLPTGTAPGCHSITLMVTHQADGLQFAPKDPDDVAYATWWAAVDADPTKFDLTPCRIPVTTDGGADGAAEATAP